MSDFLLLVKKKVVPVLLFLSVLLTFLSLGSDFVRHLTKYNYWLTIFKVDKPMTISLWFSSGLLLLDAVILFAAAYYDKKKGSKNSGFWFGLSIIFTGLSITKNIQIHTQFFKLTNQILETLHLKIAPVMIGVVLVAVLVIFYLRFFMRLSPVVKKHVLIAAFFYILMNLTVKVIGKMIAKKVLYGSYWLSALQEISEMAGAVFLIQAIAVYLLETQGQRADLSKLPSFSDPKYSGQNQK